MIIVSNTSPITNLSAIVKIQLLEQLYGEIIISSAVFQELTQWGDSIPGAKEVKTYDWIMELGWVHCQNLLTLCIYRYLSQFL